MAVLIGLLRCIAHTDTYELVGDQLLVVL